MNTAAGSSRPIPPSWAAAKAAAERSGRTAAFYMPAAACAADTIWRSKAPYPSGALRPLFPLLRRPFRGLRPALPLQKHLRRAKRDTPVLYKSQAFFICRSPVSIAPVDTGRGQSRPLIACRGVSCTFPGKYGGTCICASAGAEYVGFFLPDERQAIWRYPFRPLDLPAEVLSAADGSR